MLRAAEKGASKEALGAAAEKRDRPGRIGALRVRAGAGARPFYLLLGGRAATVRRAAPSSTRSASARGRWSSSQAATSSCSVPTASPSPIARVWRQCSLAVADQDASQRWCASPRGPGHGGAAVRAARQPWERARREGPPAKRRSGHRLPALSAQGEPALSLVKVRVMRSLEQSVVC